MKDLIDRQRAHFCSGKTLSLGERRRRLHALYRAVEEHDHEVLKALKADLGKCAEEAYASEVAYILGDIRYALGQLGRWMKPSSQRVPMMLWPGSSQVVPEPFGVALIIGPWNYPFQLLFSPLVSALAAGNNVVLKPSEHAPQTSAVVGRVIESAFTPDEVAVVEGGVEASRALLGEKFDKIFFTGGTVIGREVMRAAAEHLTPVTLELGGKSPCIVAADANIEVAARRIAWGKFLNAGQTCVAPDHVWVDRRVANEFVEALKRVVVEFYGEHPKQSNAYGRIVNARHHQRLVAYLSDGVVVAGGDADVAELYLAPTVMTGVSLTSPVMQEEIFGPVLPVLEYDDIDEVIMELRGRPAPLALYLFSEDLKLEQRVVREVRSGGACVNDTISHLIDRRLPFGGLGESGMGACHGKAGFDAFSHRRTVMRRGTWFDPDFRYPPVKLAVNQLKRVMRWFG